VSYESGIGLAREFGIPFLESSAKTGENVNEVFMLISKTVLRNLDDDRRPERSTTSTANIIRSEHLTSSIKRDGSCC